MQKDGMVDGIDTERLSNTIDAITAHPDMAKFRFRGVNKWIDGTHARTVVKDFYGANKEDASRSKPFVIDTDEPDVLLGRDQGPNATELALAALASCLNVSFVTHAAARGVKIDDLEIDLEGDLDVRGFLGLSDQVPSGFENIRVTFKVKSDAPREQIEELCKIAQDRSPVFGTVAHPTPVSVQLETESVSKGQRGAREQEEHRAA